MPATANEPTPAPGGPNPGALIAGTIIVVATIAAYVYLEGHGGDTVRLLTFVAPLAAALLVVRIAGGLRTAITKQLTQSTDVQVAATEQAVTVASGIAVEDRELFKTIDRKLTQLQKWGEGLFVTNSRRIDELAERDRRAELIHQEFTARGAQIEKLLLDVADLRRQVALLTSLLTAYVDKSAAVPPSVKREVKAGAEQVQKAVENPPSEGGVVP